MLYHIKVHGSQGVWDTSASKWTEHGWKIVYSSFFIWRCLDRFTLSWWFCGASSVEWPEHRSLLIGSCFVCCGVLHWILGNVSYQLQVDLFDLNLFKYTGLELRLKTVLSVSIMMCATCMGRKNPISKELKTNVNLSLHLMFIVELHDLV